MPVLYLVATPIGNLEDTSFRALRVLKEVGLVAAEDTRVTRRLFSRYSINTPITSYHDQNKKAKLPLILSRLRETDVALVSEAGTPGLNDPGFELVCAAIKEGIPVVPIPGASVVVTALVVSGLPTHSFLYLGFLPRRKGERRRLLASVAKEHYTIVALESPHRFAESIEDIAEIVGERRIAVCRELTKVHEEVFRGTPSQAMEHFREPRGEFTLVIEGFTGKKDMPDAKDVEGSLRQLRNTGLPPREAVARVAASFDLPKREVYRVWLKLAQGGDIKAKFAPRKSAKRKGLQGE